MGLYYGHRTFVYGLFTSLLLLNFFTFFYFTSRRSTFVHCLVEKSMDVCVNKNGASKEFITESGTSPNDDLFYANTIIIVNYELA